MKRIISILAATLACVACQPPPEGTQVAAVPPAEPVCHDFATPVTAGGRPEQARGQACDAAGRQLAGGAEHAGIAGPNLCVGATGSAGRRGGPPCTATTEPVPTQSVAMQQLYGTAYGRRTVAAGLHRGLPATRRKLEDHADYAGVADAGLPGAAAPAFSPYPYDYPYPVDYAYPEFFPYWLGAPWYFGLAPSIVVVQRFHHFHYGFPRGFGHGFAGGFGPSFGIARAGGDGGRR